MSAYATALLESPHKDVVEEALRQSDARAEAEARIRALEAQIATLRAEVARKDEALRQAIDILRVQGFPQMADYCRAYLTTLDRERDDAMTTHPDSDRRG